MSLAEELLSRAIRADDTLSLNKWRDDATILIHDQEKCIAELEAKHARSSLVHREYHNAAVVAARAEVPEWCKRFVQTVVYQSPDGVLELYRRCPDGVPEELELPGILSADQLRACGIEVP